MLRVRNYYQFVNTKMSYKLGFSPFTLINKEPFVFGGRSALIMKQELCISLSVHAQKKRTRQEWVACMCCYTSSSPDSILRNTVPCDDHRSSSAGRPGWPKQLASGVVSVSRSQAPSPFLGKLWVARRSPHAALRSPTVGRLAGAGEAGYWCNCLDQKEEGRSYAIPTQLTVGLDLKHA